MLNYLLVCRSVTYAQRTARALDNAGIGAVILRTPRGLHVNGCSYCVKINERHIATALVVIKDASLPPVRVFTQSDAGAFGELLQYE